MQPSSLCSCLSKLGPPIISPTSSSLPFLPSGSASPPFQAFPRPTSAVSFARCFLVASVEPFVNTPEGPPYTERRWGTTWPLATLWISTVVGLGVQLLAPSRRTQEMACYSLENDPPNPSVSAQGEEGDGEGPKLGREPGSPMSVCRTGPANTPDNGLKKLLTAGPGRPPVDDCAPICG